MMNTSLRDRFVFVGLLVLCLVPTGAGIARLVELAGSPVVTEANARFVNNPLPIVVHIASGVLFLLFGAAQVARLTRRRSLGWHRLAGRVVGPLGIVCGASGVWLTLAYWTITRDGPVLFALRLVSGCAMAACIVVGVVAVVRGNVVGHRAWMLRGYALGAAAGTQFFTHLPLFLVHGGPSHVSQLETTLAMAAGWIINLVVVEWHLREAPSTQPDRTPLGAAGHTA
jgi:hypothetical protein